MILCCGEALIDFLPAETASGEAAFQHFIGGSIYNVAIALGRLGVPAGYCGGISEDFFGDLLIKGLVESQVERSFVIRSPLPSTLAFVNFENGQPRYAFIDEGSAARHVSYEQLPELPEDVTTLHLGSLSLIHGPAASAWQQLAIREAGRRLISIDPNIRPSVVDDRNTYIARLEGLLAIADLIKVSDEDLDWLYPGRSHEDCAQSWLAQNASLVVITRGSKGVNAWTKTSMVAESIAKIDVVDTIGAGDSFMAALLTSLSNQNLLETDKISKIDNETVSTALKFSTSAAAITVSRAGANPPWDKEMAKELPNL